MNKPALLILIIVIAAIVSYFILAPKKIDNSAPKTSEEKFQEAQKDPELIKRYTDEYNQIMKKSSFIRTSIFTGKGLPPKCTLEQYLAYYARKAAL